MSLRCSRAGSATSASSRRSSRSPAALTAPRSWRASGPRSSEGAPRSGDGLGKRGVPRAGALDADLARGRRPAVGPQGELQALLRERARDPVRPLDEQGALPAHEIEEPRGVELVLVADAVEVRVVDREAA